MPSFYLSFCDTSRPQGSQFLGGCVVEAPDMGGAINRASALGCNPGGDELVLKRCVLPSPEIPGHWRDRLLSAEEIEQMDASLA